LKPMQAMPDLREVERELDRLKMERERLGAVNLRAEEEQKELSKARGADQGARRPHRSHPQAAHGHPEPQPRRPRTADAAFDIVNGHFQRLFVNCSAAASRAAADRSDDPLEAGLEILASRPARSRRR
jgi:chromosome segregation protein